MCATKISVIPDIRFPQFIPKRRATCFLFMEIIYFIEFDRRVRVHDNWMCECGLAPENNRLSVLKDKASGISEANIRLLLIDNVYLLISMDISEFKNLKDQGFGH